MPRPPTLTLAPVLCVGGVALMTQEVSRAIVWTDVLMFVDFFLWSVKFSFEQDGVFWVCPGSVSLDFRL